MLQQKSLLKRLTIVLNLGFSLNIVKITTVSSRGNLSLNLRPDLLFQSLSDTESQGIFETEYFLWTFAMTETK